MKQLFIPLAIFSLSIAHAQQKPVEYIGRFQSEEELSILSDSLQTPLLVYNNMVYEMHSDCIIKAFGAAYNDRNGGGESNNRSASGNANNRNSNGNNNDRQSTGTSGEREDDGTYNNRHRKGSSNDRKSGSRSNDRSASGNANDRKNSGLSNDRRNAGDVMVYGCNVDKKHRLTIYFKKIKDPQNLKIYYNHLFFTNKYFKIKTL